MRIPFFNTYIHPSASREIEKVLASGFLSEGEVVSEFERLLETTLELKNCVALNSGTSALHLALSMAGIKEGDEVILPAQTFIATGLSVLYQKAIPVFADIDLGSGNLSASSVRKKVSPKTKAIIPVHWAGYPCDMDAITQVAREFNLVVIEDAAQALGATYNSMPVGSISDFTCFSFQSIKHVTTGDGGALCVKDPALVSEARSRRWFGINRSESPVNALGERSYNVQVPGYKYHMNNYAAALGVANLRNYKERLARRILIARFYQTNLTGVSGLRLFEKAPGRESAHWLFGAHVEKRDHFIRALRDRGIASSVVHQRIDRNSVFGGKADLPNQLEFDRTQIHIPIHDGIDLEKAGYIVDTIKSGW
ncbi:MAG: DegT/DnrJ/EryC1/StrS family aminotransferase [Cytophagales bacterium]|nr:DegT/DnrJ/EryC1/StrS family aminotransferase [Cytophagales bacterium]